MSPRVPVCKNVSAVYFSYFVFLVLFLLFFSGGELTLQPVTVKCFPAQFPVRSRRLRFRLIKILEEGGLCVS